MIHHSPRTLSTEPELADAQVDGPRGDLARVAGDLADAARALAPSCTTAVAVEVGSRWQLLAQAGSVDVASDWRGTLAASSGGGDGPRQGDGYAVAVIPVRSFRALLILVAESDSGVGSRVLDSVGGLLAQSAQRLEAARAAQQRDRASRRMETLSRRHTRGAPVPRHRPARDRDRCALAARGGELLRPGTRAGTPRRRPAGSPRPPTTSTIPSSTTRRAPDVCCRRG